MKLTRFARMFALPAALALLPLSAHADTFDWSVTGPDASLGGFAVTGSGTLTATLSGGVWTVDSISGAMGGSSITTLSNFEGADNQIFPGDTLLDTNGLGFETAASTQYDIFSFFAPGSTVTLGNNFGEFVSSTGFGGVGTFNLVDTNSPVPEPSTFVLLGTGLLGAAGAVRRKFLRG
jgi:hypothetical protein